MAEVVIGVVASGVGFAAFAGQLLDSVIKLQNLWTAVRNAPDDILLLVEDIAIVTNLISDIEPQFGQSSTAESTTPAAFNKCLLCFKRSVKDLEDLASKLESALKRNRKSGAVKVVLKKETIQNHRSRLESAKNTLNLAFQSYQAILQIQNARRQEATHALVASNTQTLSSFMLSKSVSNREGGLVDSPVSSTVSLQLQTSQVLVQNRDNKHCYRKQHQETVFKFRMSSLWLRKVWDIQVKRSYSGWALSLSSPRILPDDAPVLEHAREGNLLALQSLFTNGQASPYDCGETGLTALHSAAANGELDVCRYLLQQGADVNASDAFTHTPLRVLYWFCSDNQARFLLVGEDYREPGNYSALNRVLALFRLLLLHPEHDPVLDPLIDQFYGPSEAFKLLQEQVCPLRRDRSPDEQALAALHSLYLPEMSSCQDPEIVRLALGGPFKLEHFRFCATVEGMKLDLFTAMSFNFGRLYHYGKLPSHWLPSWRTILAAAVQLNAPWCSFENGISPLLKFLEGNIGPFLRAGKEPTLSLQSWARELGQSGVDLIEYGKQEQSLLQRTDARIYLWYGRTSRLLSLHVIGISYGPNPEDWQIWTSWPLDEWAGDFWNVIENPELFMPGAWV